MTTIRNLTFALSRFSLSLPLIGVASAESVPAATKPATPATTAPPPAAPAKTAAPVATGSAEVTPVAKPTPPAETREQLLEQLKKANEQLATDKKAAAEAGKGKDKAAIQAAKDKVRPTAKQSTRST